MKKFIIMILMLISIALTGCDPGIYIFDVETLIEETVKIELVESYNDNPKRIVVKDDVITSFDYSSTDLLEVLEEEYYESFLREFVKITYHIDNRTINKPVGKTLIFHRKNGDMLVFSDTEIRRHDYPFASRFDKDCNYITHMGALAYGYGYNEVLSKYFASY